MARSRGKRVSTGEGVRVAGKAANGAGSIYAVAEGGYKATYIDPFTGKRRTVSGRTKGEAESRRAEKLTELAELAESHRHGPLGADPTVGALVAWWVDNVAAVAVRPSTLHTYRKDCARITEHLGAVRLADLDAEGVRGFLAAMAEQGLGPATIHNARTRLRQIAKQGIAAGYLDRDPTAGVASPKVQAEQRKTRRVLTPAETQALVGSLDGSHPLDGAVALLFTSGVRVNEVLGLAWSDLDLDAGTATIRRGCTYTGGGVGARLDATKTTATGGVHHLAPSVVALLRKRKAQQAAERLAAGPAWETVTYEGVAVELVFTTLTGALMVRQPVTTHIHRRLEQIGMDPTGVGTHTGRRSAITALFVAGLPLDDVARHVGHTDPSTTARYVQDLGSRPADTARVAARLLDPAANDQG